MTSFAEFTKKKNKNAIAGTSFAGYTRFMFGDDVFIEELAPVRTTAYTSTTTEDGPVHGGGGRRRDSEEATYSANNKPEEKEKGLDFFQKGSFNDGYQFGDVTKSILGTAGDLGVNVVKGVAGLGEGIVDAGGYAVAGVTDFFGADDFAEDVRKKAQKNSVEDFFQPANDYLNQYSVLGRTSDSVAQGIGQVGAILLTGGIGAGAGMGSAGVTALTTGVMGVSSAGSGISEAYQDGASDKEATIYGLSKGIIDAGTELIFGGLGKAVNAVGLSKGISSLDDTFARFLSDKLSSQVAKNFVEYGVKASAEGFEEVLAGLGTAVAKKLTYMEEEELRSIIEDENLLEQFVVGTVTSGMIQSGLIPGTSDGSLKDAIEKDRDFVTGYTQNEQAVIDKEVENRIAEKETSGKKLSNKEKTKIEEEVKTDLQKGNINIDTIESVLGGETFKTYNSMVEKENTLKKEIEALENMPREQITVKQGERLTQAREELKKITENPAKESLKNQLRSEVTKLTEKDTFLQESYNEKARRSQKFEADLTKYDAKQQEVIKRATDSGILNNTRKTHEFVDMIAKISADKGVLFDFTNNKALKESGFALDGKTINGYVKDGNIALNIDSNKSLNTVVGHEITHILEGTDLYTELQNAVKEYATTKGEYDSRFQALSKIYEGVESVNIDNELTADLVGDYLFTDSDFINNLSTQKPNVFKKIYEEIKYLYKLATAGSKEARELEKVKRAFDKAYKESANKNTAVEYSLEKTSDGTEYVKTDKDLFVKEDGTPLTEKEVFDSLVNHEFALPEGNVKIVNRLPGKYMYHELYKRRPNYKGVEDIKQLNSEVNYNMEELLDNSKMKKPNVPDINGKHSKQGIDSFDTRTVSFYDGKKAYTIDFSIATLSDGEKVAYAKKFYGLDEDLTKKIQDSETMGEKSQLNQKPVSDLIVTENEKKSSESNKKLTKEQEAYFKDSVVRDENGNLKVMYHGTSKGGHTVFDPYGASNYGLFGVGTYFTDNKSVAESYTEKGKGNNKQIYETYLNITNPIDMDAQANPEAWKKALPDANFPESGTNEDFYRAMEEYFADNEYAKWEASETALEVLESMGYDGITHIGGGRFNKADDTRHQVYIAFHPEQIKNIDNTNPTTNPDIRYSLSDDVKKAEDYFGTTYKISEAGYLLTDGKLLDLSGKHDGGPGGYRSVDHREITDAFEGNYGDGSYSGGMIQFIQAGNIRLSPESGGINLAVKPNKAQLSALDRFITNFRGEVILDIDDANGNTVASVEYPKRTYSKRIINDINEYFDNGVIPESPTSLGQFRYSLSEDNINKVTDDGLTMTYVRVPNQNTQNYGSTYGQNIEPAGEYMSMDTSKGKHKIDGYEYGTIQFKKPLVLEHINTSDTGWKKTVSDMYNGLTGKKLTNALIKDGYDAIVTYDEYGYSEIVNLNGKKLNDNQYSLSGKQDVAPIGNYNVYGKDIALETPMQSTVSEKENVAPTKEVVKDSVIDEYAPITEAQANERDAMQSDRINTLDESMMPEEADIFYDLDEMHSNATTEAKSPFDDKDIQEVGDRKQKAYMYENPEVKPYFQEEAQIMLGELRNSVKGERVVNADLVYESAGELGVWGTKRETSEQIAYMLDRFKYSYADIEKGLNAIIEDHGAENNAISKRLEFMIDERLREGYTDFLSGMEIPSNQEYINLLNEKQISEYSDEAYNKYLESLAQSEPTEDVEDIAPTKEYEAIEPRPQNLDELEEQWAKNKMSRVNTSKKAEYEKIAKVLDAEPTTESHRNERKWAIFKANVLDKGAVFEDLALKTKNRDLMGKWNYTLYSEAMAQRLMGNGDAEAGVKSLNDIRAEVENTGLTKQFYEYMYHKHNVDRMNLESKEAQNLSRLKKEIAKLKLDTLSDKQLMAISMGRITENTTAERISLINTVKEYLKAKSVKNKPVFGYSVTADVSQEIVDQYEFAQPEFMDYAQDVYNYQTYLRQQLVDNGVITQETADLWSEMYPHYVPIRRVTDSDANKIDVPLFTERTSVNAPIKKATGGNTDILPLFDTMAMRTVQTYKATAKNSFGVELKNTLGTTVENAETDVDEVIDNIDTQEGLLQEGKNGRKPTFTVFENGERVTFEITEDMYDAFKPISDSSLLSKTVKPLNVASNFHRGLLTEYNPVFILTNGIKDIQDILINSQHAVRTYAKIPEAFAQLTTKGYWYNEYMDNGGDSNSYFDSDTNTFKTENKGLAKMLDLPPLSTISKLNNYIEMIPRLAEYMASREAGRSIEVSMLDSARVTTNFRAGGDLTKFLNRNGATFLNASVQGAMQQVRNVREAKANGLKGWVNLATKFAVAGLPAYLLNALLWDDDEEYEELSDYVKQNYYIVGKYDDGKFIRIPKGRTVAVIQDAIKQISDTATGNDEADLKSFLQLVVTNLAPANPIENNILAPIMQVKNNETWYGDDLVPTRLQDLPASEQYDESTDVLSKWLGEKLDISPVKINYLIDQYSGGLGDVVLPMLTPEAESGDNSVVGNMIAPLKKKFTVDSVMNNQNVSDFYETSEELTTNAKKSTATDEDVLKNKYINSVKADMSELYKQKREIQNSDLPDNEKYTKVREIQSQIVELSKEGLKSHKGVNISGDYATVGDRHYKRNDEGEWTKITDKQFEKQNEVTTGLGISASDYWRNKEEYDYAYENPEKHALTKALGGYETYKAYTSELHDIKADKDEEGKSISGSRKEKVLNYIDGLEADYGEKVLLFKSEYPADDTYNEDIIEYLNNRDDISYSEMEIILKELGFTVENDGTISW